jgi:hypothetical protein
MNPIEKTTAGRNTPSLALFALSEVIKPIVVAITKTRPISATT